MHSNECKQYQTDHNNNCFSCPNWDNCIKDIEKLATEIMLIGTPFEDKK
jgi:hypothetical protein